MIALIRAAGVVACFALLPFVSAAAQTQQSQDTTEAARLRAQVAALRAEFGAYQNEVDAQLLALRDSARLGQAGTTRFVLTGYGFTRYASTQGGTATFTTEFAPILLWHVNERLLFQAETEFEMAEELETEVEYANVSYMATDFLNVGAGKFLTPFSIFGPRLHAAWINKAPNPPLAFAHGGIVPTSGVGAYARGGFVLAQARASYAVYAVNAPLLATDGHDAGAIEPIDESDERAYGGRLGLFFLRPGMEVGFSYLTADVVTMRGVDATFSRHIAPLRGNVDVRVEAVVSESDSVQFAAEMPGDPPMVLLDNRREGGYGQVAYRPSRIGPRFVRNVELVGRYEWMVRPDWMDEITNDTKRYTGGAGLWLTPSTLVKVALQRTENSMIADTKVFLVQVAMGF